MVKLRAFLAVFVAAALAGSAMAASAARVRSSRPLAKGSGIIDHIPQLDGPMTTRTGPDGRMWATWSYRASGEFDIAISSTDSTATTWLAPTFVGRRNGSDEIDPTIAVDSDGAVYIAFTMTYPSRVAVAVLAPGSSSWTEPFVVSGTEIASSAALLVVDQRLIVGFRTGRGVRMVLPTFGSGYQINGIQDGPDGVDPLGAKDHGVGSDGPSPASSNGPNR